MTKAESEQLARALQEEQYFELSQENKKAGARHKQEIVEKETTIARVRVTSNSPLLDNDDSHISNGATFIVLTM